MTGNLKDQRAHGLDALRGIAASAVVFVHAVQIHPLGVSYNKWIVDYFLMGVPLFFIISAMSMSLAYPKGISFDRSWAYALRRFFRIAPLFYVMLFAWLYVGLQAETGTIIRNMTFLFGFFPSEQTSLVPAGWSIGVEAIFYLLFPFLWVWRNIWAAVFLLLITCLGWTAVNANGQGEVPDYYYWTSFFTNAPYFALGLIIWCIYRSTPTSLKRLIGYLTLAAGMAGLICLYLYGPVVDQTQTQYKPVSLVLVLGWGFAFASLALSQALRPVSFLYNPFTRFLGKISYSLYLMHPFLIYNTNLTRWAATLTDNPDLVVPVVCAVTLAVAIPIATVIYYAVEVPFMRLARRITKPDLRETMSQRQTS
ncbi:MULTISPECIES: acyltransferase [unclassified Ruegeria]|uniref:acyltransferase family protein n=2 Tax=Ruegeria TaxID=97050 RepID=UPI001492F06F|nr:MULTISPECIES: acyltransferase [unclassified Ruegeria]NOC45017.1 acyltransferase family protein [Ruegeria sp. HKCCD7559]